MHGKRNDHIVRAVFGLHLADAEVFNHGAAKESPYRCLMGPRLIKHLAPGVMSFLGRHQKKALVHRSSKRSASVPNTRLYLRT